jgi:hypothetical protein
MSGLSRESATCTAVTRRRSGADFVYKVGPGMTYGGEAMTLGTIDRATAYMVPAVFTFKQPSESFNWARGPALGFTLAGLFLDRVSLIADPTETAPAGGVWGEFLASLGDWVTPEKVKPGPLRSEVLAVVHAYGQQRLRLQAALEAAALDPNFPAWLRWHATHEWEEHTARMGGFFDIEFADEIAAVVGTSTMEIQAMWARVSKQAAVRQLRLGVENGTSTDSDQIAIKAWLLATLLRGVFHDELSRRRRRQNLRHPIRSVMTGPSETARDPIRFAPTSAEQYFAGIILGLSFAARGVANRSRLYGTNLLQSRAAAASGHLLLDSVDTDMTAAVGLDRAIREAQNLLRRGILTADRKALSRAVDISASTAAALVAFFLSPWESLGTAIVAGTSLQFLQPGGRAVRKRATSYHRLTDLGAATAGALDFS